MRRLLARVPLALLTAVTAAAVVLALSEAPGRHAVPVAVGMSTTTNPFAPTTTSTTQPHELHVDPGTPTGTSIPAFCSFGYPSNKWPPPRNAALEARLLTKSDVSSVMTRYPPIYASNGPDYDQIAVGYPKDPIAGVGYFVPYAAVSLGLSELLGQAPSPGAAAAQVRFALNKVIGQCESIGTGSPYAPYTLAPADSRFSAYETSYTGYRGNGDTGGAVVTVWGSVGDYVFEVEIGNYMDPAATSPPSLPSQEEVMAELQAVTAHLSD